MGNALTSAMTTLSDCNIPAVALFVGCAVLASGAAITFVRLLRRISGSVGVAPPTAAMLRDEDPSRNCALFRHFPALAETLAWRSLGAQCPTPVHACRLPLLGDASREVEFLLKREDLISDRYGGNKVRTLQHQLAVCEARRDDAKEPAFQQLVSIGSGGSNQAVATVVHAAKLGWDGENAAAVNACWFDKD